MISFKKRESINLKKIVGICLVAILICAQNSISLTVLAQATNAIHWTAEDVRVPTGQNYVDLVVDLDWGNVTPYPVNAVILTLFFEPVGAFTLQSRTLAPGTPGTLTTDEVVIPTPESERSAIAFTVVGMSDFEGEIGLRIRLGIAGGTLSNVGDYITIGMLRAAMPGAPPVTTGVTVVRCDCGDGCSICEDAGGEVPPVNGGSGNGSGNGGGNGGGTGGSGDGGTGGGAGGSDDGGTGGGTGGSGDGGTGGGTGGSGNGGTGGGTGGSGNGGTGGGTGGSGNGGTGGGTGGSGDGGTGGGTGGSGNGGTGGGGSGTGGDTGNQPRQPSGVDSGDAPRSIISRFVPITGDDANMVLWGTLFGAGLLGLIGALIILVASKKKSQNAPTIIIKGHGGEDSVIKKE